MPVFKIGNLRDSGSVLLTARGLRVSEEGIIAEFVRLDKVERPHCSKYAKEKASAGPRDQSAWISMRNGEVF